MAKPNRFAVLRPVLSLATKIPAFADHVIDAVADELEEAGDISADNAEAIAAQALEGVGTDVIRVKVNGQDIADARTEELLARLLGRVTFNVRQALRHK